MITTPFGMKECIEHNSEPIAVMRDKTRIIELMYDIFSRLAGTGAGKVKNGSAKDKSREC